MQKYSQVNIKPY